MTLLLISHIFLAFTSMAYAAYVYMSPSKAKINAARVFAASTLATGTALLVVKPSHLLQACIVGSIYLGIVSVAILFAERKLARETVRSD